MHRCVSGSTLKLVKFKTRVVKCKCNAGKQGSWPDWLHFYSISTCLLSLQPRHKRTLLVLQVLNCEPKNWLTDWEIRWYAACRQSLVFGLMLILFFSVFNDCFKFSFLNFNDALFTCVMFVFILCCFNLQWSAFLCVFVCCKAVSNLCVWKALYKQTFIYYGNPFNSCGGSSWTLRLRT